MGIIGDLLFPEICVNCGKSGGYICRECGVQIEPREAICPMCEKLSIDGDVHGRCRKAQGVDRLVAPVRYRGAVQKLLKKVKYKSAWKMIEELVDYWWKEGGGELNGLGEEWVVTAVPMHDKRKRARGFNQAEVMAVMLSRKMGAKYEKLLVRVRSTKAQYGLSKKERGENVRGAFEVGEDVKGRNVLVVDDVWTTGSTIRECGKVLKRSGVEKVWGVVMGR